MPDMLVYQEFDCTATISSQYSAVFLLQKGTKAPQAAGKIHTDFEKGFIMAEVMKFSDFKEEGSESAVKVCLYVDKVIALLGLNISEQYLITFNPFAQAAGKYRQQGRNYIVEDGDIIFFKFNTPNAPKKKP